MAKQETEHSRYPSKFSPNSFVTVNQWLAEYICNRLSIKQGKQLGIKFWEKSDYWNKELKKQLRFVASLLKLYSAKAISKAIQKNTWITSFANKKLQDFVRQEQEILDLAEKVKQENVDVKKEESKPIDPSLAKIEDVKPVANKSIANLLDDL